MVVWLFSYIALLVVILLLFDNLFLSGKLLTF